MSKRSEWTWLGAAAALAWGLGPVNGQAQEVVLVEIDGLRSREVVGQGFALSAGQDVRIEAVGADDRFRRDGWGWNDNDYWAGNAWILDAQSRRVVWELREARTARDRGGIHRFEGNVRLPAGEYIAYYAAFTPQFGRGWDRRRRAEPVDDDLGLTIRGTGTRLERRDLQRLQEAFDATAVVSFTSLEEDADERSNLIVTRPTEVEIYAIGEAFDGVAYDYAMIVDAETREPVWRFTDRSSDYAGGADKNRQFRFTMTLPPGTYAVLAMTDGSHDAWEWNAPPPYDPEYWGLTIRVTDPANRDAIRAERYAVAARRAASIVDLTGVGDREAREAGFTLDRPMEVRVYALGEGTNGRMYDYGWIIDATTRERVWEMEYYDTDNAGGADKNRVADETIRLDAGNYLVYYVTDGSHAYRDWNAAPPPFGDQWGISIDGGSGYAADAVRPFEPGNDPNVLAQLVGIGDHERRRRSFSLDRETDVRIYALGEGIDGRMYDFAWIEDARTRRTVWEMDYRDTDRAGGARKNRLFDGVVRLGAGEYILRYESDGSHSTDDWNDAPPADAFHYGATVYLAGRR